MLKQVLLFAGLVLSAVCAVNAQDADRSLSGHFSSSIVVKVYEVSSIVKMDRDQQYKLAMAYNRQDSLLAKAIAEGRPAGEIGSPDKASIRILQQVLTQPQFAAYCEAKGGEFADVAVGGEMDYIKKEYRPDSVTIRSIRARTVNRYRYIYQNYLLEGIDKDKTEERVGNLARLFDNYEFFPMLYSNRYATDYLEKLNAISKIPDTTAARIRAMFNGMIVANKYTDWAGAINRATQYYHPDTAFFSTLFRGDFEKQAFELSATDRYNLIKVHRVTGGAYDSIYSLVKEKNYARAVVQYTYANYHYKKCDSLIGRVSRHYDSLITATLLRNGAVLSADQFALALRYKDILGLRESLIDTLVNQAMYLDARIDSILTTDPDAHIDFGAYQSAHLSQWLSDDQYNLLLSYKNRPVAISDANSDWNEMELRGLTTGLNKEDVLRQISAFYMLKDNAWNRLAYDKIAQWSTQRVISDSKPECLKILDPLRWNGDTTKTTNTLKLQW